MMTAERALDILGDGLFTSTIPYSVDELKAACQIACDAIKLCILQKKPLTVETPAGNITAEAGTDAKNPGLWISLRRPGEDYAPALALVEYTEDEADIGGPAIITRVWQNLKYEEYTNRVLHTGFEKRGEANEHGAD